MASTTEQTIDLGTARDRALEVRALYEILEQRINGKVWSLHEIMLGLSNDIGTIGRLILAHDGTWSIDGDVDGQLAHKLAEAMWWVFVVADRLDIDMSDAFSTTMNQIHSGLDAAVKSEV